MFWTTAILLTVFISACWVLVQIDRHKKRNELITEVLAMKHINGKDEAISYAVAKLIDEQEYLIQLLNSGTDITFAGNGAFEISAAPLFQVYDNVCVVTQGRQRLEFMRLDTGQSKLLRVTELGPRGATRTKLEIGEWVLLQVLTRLHMIREESDV